MLYRPKNSPYWYMDFVLKGHRVNKSTRKKDKREAALVETAERAKLAQELEDGQISTGKDMLLTVAVQRAMEERFQYNSDGDVTKARLEAAISFLGATKKLKDITTDDLAAFRSHLLKAGRAPSTTNRYVGNLKTVLNMAHDEWGTLKAVPKVRRLKEPEGRLWVFSPEDEARLIEWFATRDYAPQHQKRGVGPLMADLVVVLVETGMRLSEALSCTYQKQIDLRAGVIWLSGDMTKGKRRRKIPLTDRARSILEERRVKNPTRPFPISKDGACAQMNLAKEALGWTDPDICLHALRHTCATRLLKAKVDIVTVQEWLGHADIQTTRRYLHYVEGSLEDAARKLTAASGMEALRVYKPQPVALALVKKEKRAEGE